MEEDFDVDGDGGVDAEPPLASDVFDPPEFVRGEGVGGVVPGAGIGAEGAAVEPAEGAEATPEPFCAFPPLPLAIPPAGVVAAGAGVAISAEIIEFGDRID